ncbi:ribonuclease H-like domain-containing protein, partial [Ochromonadaceae sp. CCMP2298]
MGACAGTAVAVAAVDCEMCDTAAGLELTRVSLLAADNSLLLDTYVKPSMPITDYRTQYSGINPHTLQHVTVTLRMVQLALLRLISADTVLVGHSLNSDLRALKISHSRCLDTSLLYPHPRGYPLRLKLKQLALDYLNQRIQRNEGIGAAGHDSTEDARAALQLALLK